MTELGGAGTVPHREGPRWTFLLWWVAACFAGWTIGGPVGISTGTSDDPSLTGGVSVAVGALTAGIMQWVVLRGHLARAWWWIAACIAAALVVAFIVITIPAIDAGTGVAAGGLVLGALQWPILRGQVMRAGWWILASTVGWVVGGFLSGAFEGGFLGWGTIGFVYGAITGVVLLWLLRHPRPPGEQPLATPPDR